MMFSQRGHFKASQSFVNQLIGFSILPVVAVLVAVGCFFGDRSKW
jgi:hypothetical protein